MRIPKKSGGYLKASLGMKTHWFLLFKLWPAIQKNLYFLSGVMSLGCGVVCFLTDCSMVITMKNHHFFEYDWNLFQASKVWGMVLGNL